MNAEIISIGTELLLGHTVNRDATIVSRLLAELGFGLYHIQTVGDNAGRLLDALKLARSRATLIVTTGGLGPTDDDLSKHTVARFAGVPLVEDANTVKSIREYFGSRPITPNQFSQAKMPDGAIIFPNSVGTAPGCAVPFGNGGYVIMLPGPPAELQAMLENSVRPFLASLSQSTVYSTVLRTFGIGEGAAAHKIADLMTLENPTVAPYAHGGEMFVKITAKAADKDKARDLCEPIISEIRKRLGQVVYGRDVNSLEEQVVSSLIERGITIATAESCTGGLLAKRITDQPGASAIFSVGAITYSNEAKENLLNIPASLLSTHGAVSPDTARAMAENVRKLGATDLGIGITGIAGPTGATPAKPLGLVYISLAFPNDTVIREMRPLGKYPGREAVRERAASHALDLVRRYLENLPFELIWE